MPTWLERLLSAFGAVRHGFVLGSEAETNAVERSLAAIDTVLAIASWSLTIMGIIVALVAIVGYTQLKASAIQRAELMAETRISQYMKSEEFSDRLERLARERVQAWVEAQQFERYISPEADGGEADAFPSVPEGKRDDPG
jgi:hypothetical protein